MSHTTNAEKTVEQINTLSTLMDEANSYQGGEYPTLFIIGSVHNSVNIDGSIISRVGRINGSPIYKITPRYYKVNNDGSLKIMDNHPDWLEENNETEVIGQNDIELGIIAEPANENLRISKNVHNFVTLPDRVKYESVSVSTPLLVKQ